MQKKLEKVTAKIKNSRFIKILALFIAFQIVFSSITGVLLVFYGPFENVKRTIVGMASSSMTKQWVAKMFLSDEAIDRILQKNREPVAVNPQPSTQEVIPIELKKNHNGKMEFVNLYNNSLSGKLLIIHDPTRIKVGISSKMPKSGETTSTIAKKANAVAAINAGGFKDDLENWSGTGGLPQGFIIQDGKFTYNEPCDYPRDTVGFTEEGKFITGQYTDEQLKSMKVKEAVCFGPSLIINGKPQFTDYDGGQGFAPRTAIGQRADGAVLLLVIDGRTIKSLGVTIRDTQNILLQYGAVNAANLDGGSSTTLYFDGKVRNHPSDGLGERTVSSAFIVMPEKAVTVNK